MKSASTQTGMSTLGMLLTIGVAAFFLTCAFRLGPAYLDNRFIVGALETLGESASELNSMSNREIQRKLSQIFQLNNVRGEVTKEVEIDRGDGKVIVSVNYEQRIHMFLNIDVILTFNNELDSSRPDACCKVASE